MALAPGFAAGAAFPDDAAVWDFSMLKRLVLSFLFFGGTAVVLGGLLFSGALGTRPAGDDAASTGAASAPPLAGTVADFTRFDPPRPAPETPFADGDGNGMSLADFRGRVVLLNFWATWCAPCRVEMPAFEAAFQRHGGTDFTVLAVNNAESAAAVQAFRQELDLSFPLLVDLDGAVQYRYGIQLYPSTFLIDADGAIIARHFGALTEAQLDSMLASALGS